MRLSPLTITLPNFDSELYLSLNPDVSVRLSSSNITAVQDYLTCGLDEGREPTLQREPPAVPASIDRVIVSDAGFFFILGWIGDEGLSEAQFTLRGRDFTIAIPTGAVLRHSRRDVEEELGRHEYDHGFMIFGRSPSRLLIKQTALLDVASEGAHVQMTVTPETMSNKRVLDIVLTFIANLHTYRGKEAQLFPFMRGIGGQALMELFKVHVDYCVRGHYVQRFNQKTVDKTFVTVLFGAVEPLLFQPLLFRKAKVSVGEWMFVCNTFQMAHEVIRLAESAALLNDMMITVVVMPDNAGFGAANNVAISHAASSNIIIVNPDVFPIEKFVPDLNAVICPAKDTSIMRGGLLFYDDDNVMHSGMFATTDSFPIGGANFSDSSGAATLLRIEHYDKGVPFREGDFKAARDVRAITGAVMAFDREMFERIGGFSTNYIFGHYEDADLSLRWADANGRVVVDPKLRFIHLEGQGSRFSGEHYRGASMVNRYFFTLCHGNMKVGP